MDGIYLVPFSPFIVGYFYTHGIWVGSHTLKLRGSVGVKNIIVGITWGGTIALIAGQWTSSIVTVAILFLFYGSSVFVNSCVNDFKDFRGTWLQVSGHCRPVSARI